MRMNKCAAGIVSFNPNIKRLKENIDSIVRQVDIVIIFDNGSKNIDKIEEILSIDSYNNIILIKSEVNKGIAYALNIITKKAKDLGFEWILTLDQDSITQSGTINKFFKYINIEKVAIICPRVIDKRRKNIIYEESDEEYTYISFSITSGSLINTSIYEKIGGFDEWLFIGLVDNDYCKRIELMDYKILQVNSIILDHELGNLTKSKLENFYIKLGDILHSEIIKKLSYKREVNPMRLYYATRNMIYMMKKYRDYDKGYFKSINSILKNCLSSVIRGKNKLKLLKNIFLGIRDGINKKVDQFKIYEL